MSDPWTSIATVIGGGGTLAVVAAIIVWVTRGAIATAVTQAGAREIERLKGELATQLEEKKAAFTRELERERQQGAQALEQFKAQLTLEAEVRRQAAAKKVTVILKFIDLGNGLISKALFPVLKPHGSAPNDFHESILAMDEFRGAFREGEAFFDLEARREIVKFATDVERERDEYHKKQFTSEGASMLDAANRAEAARARFFDVLRRELQIETGEKVEKKS